MSGKRRDVLADFLKNAAAQELNVAQDDGLYRHLKIRNKAGHQFNWFDIITWPGVLTINGDYGTWVFSRIDDMFEFFRSGDRADGELRINEPYWAEKLQACDRTTYAAEEFDADTFRAEILDSLEGYGRPNTTTGKRLLIQAIDADVFSCDGEHAIREALNDFEFNGFRFSDTWEIRGKRYCYRYTYCLYSIVWAIRQYDQSKCVIAETEATA
jgi:hypothetical protein